MSDSRHERVAALFEAACDLEAEARDRFLAEACGADAAMRAEVEALLGCDAGESFLRSEDRTLALGGTTDSGLPPWSGRRVDGYTLKRVIASGGMGTVYLAVQEHPRRTVALKLMKAGIASRSTLRRFEYEAQILARLRHPGIAQVYQAGTHGEGAERVPYFAMEYVPNARPITRYAEECGPGVRSRLDLFARVCDAVHHGHQKGIIHRDLKPDNILVDTEGNPKIIDFGVARATDSDLAVTTLQTDVGQLVGTLQYMSPEQCVADPHDLDTRSDVYALGVVLYELLSGRLPYDVSSVSIPEAARVVRETPPARLSAVDVTLRGDVETIVRKAMEKDRERRYSSAAELAEDVRRYLRHEPIRARPPSVGYQVRMFARRKRAAFAVLLTVTIACPLLVVATIVAVSSAMRAEAARQAEAEAKTESDRQRDEAQRQAYVANLAAAELAIESGSLRDARERLARAPAHLRQWEWRHLSARADQSLVAMKGHDGAVRAVAFDAGAARAASGGDDGTIRLWSTRTGETIEVLEGHEQAVVAVAFAPDPARPRLASGSADGTVRIWNLGTSAPPRTIAVHDRPVSALAFDPAGRLLASASHDGTVTLHDATTYETVAPLSETGPPVLCLAFAPDGATLATGAHNGAIRLWTVETRSPLVLGDGPGSVLCVAFSRDGTRLAAGTRDGSISEWSLPDGQTLESFDAGGGAVWSVAYDGDGRLVTGGGDGRIVFWDADRAEDVSCRGHEEAVTSIAVSADGSRLLTGSPDGTVRLWDTAARPEPIVFETERDAWVFSVAFSADREQPLLAAGTGETRRGKTEGAVVIWDPSSGAEVRTLPGHGDTVTSVAFGPEGAATLIAFGTGKLDKAIRIWDVESGEERARLVGHQDRVACVAFDAGGARLVSGGHDGTARLWDVETGKMLATAAHGERVTTVAFSPDGAAVASGSSDGTIAVRDPRTLDRRLLLDAHAGEVKCVAYRADSRRLASASEDGTIVIWDLAGSPPAAVFSGHDAGVKHVAFSPDGARLVSAGAADGTVRIWDAATGETMLTLREHGRRVMGVAFSADGSRIATGSIDGTVRVWDARPAAERSR